MKKQEIENRIVQYWTIRSHDFGSVRKNELNNAMGKRWLEELKAWLPPRTHLNILDIGTGAGLFAILMAQLGHRVTGIDLVPAMLEEASAMASGMGLNIDFRQMDAQQLDFPDDTFDVVLSRNLTWTLPEPEKAYTEWHRVRKPGGLPQGSGLCYYVATVNTPPKNKLRTSTACWKQQQRGRSPLRSKIFL